MLPDRWVSQVLNLLKGVFGELKQLKQEGFEPLVEAATSFVLIVELRLRQGFFSRELRSPLLKCDYPSFLLTPEPKVVERKQ